MRRNISMERLESIPLPPLTPPNNNNRLLPPDVVTPASDTSNRSSSYFSPSSDISYDFAFLNESPGIRLTNVSSSTSFSDRDTSSLNPTGTGSDRELCSKVGEEMVDSAPLIDRQVYMLSKPTTSLDSLQRHIDDDRVSCSSLDDIHTAIEPEEHSSRYSNPNISTSERDRNRCSSTDALKSAHFHQRSFSADACSTGRRGSVHIVDDDDDASSRSSSVESGRGRTSREYNLERSETTPETDELPDSRTHSAMAFCRSPGIDEDDRGTPQSNGSATVYSPQIYTNDDFRDIEERRIFTETATEGTTVEEEEDGEMIPLPQPQYSYTSPLFVENPRDISAISTEFSPVFRTHDESMLTLASTPHPSCINLEEVFSFMEKDRLGQALTSISEESEHDQTLPRRKGPRIGTLANHEIDSFDLPDEPAELAPGAFPVATISQHWVDPKEAESQVEPPLHRRAISDHTGEERKVELRRDREMSDLQEHSDNEVDMQTALSNIKARTHVGRASSTVSNRCQSQVFLQREEQNSESAAPLGDRNLSNSDPALNEDRTDNSERPPVPANPPPVRLQRKPTTDTDSWVKYFPAAHSVHSVFTASSASLPTRQAPTSRNAVSDSSSSVKPGDRSRIEKKAKKEKSSSDTFSFGSLFGTKNGRTKKTTADRSLDGVLSNFNRAAGVTSPTAAGLHSRRQTSAGVLDSSRPPSDDLPDHISRLLSDSPQENETFGYDGFVQTPRYSLSSNKWDCYDLFGKQEYNTWHEKFRHDKLPSKTVKKQDAIYELISIEQNHCANLIFLQQAYRVRLLEENVLSLPEVNLLIPDVLDSLLVFHINLLDRLVNRQKEGDEVETISDIIAEELAEDGTHTAVCISAYTAFGAAKEQSELMFTQMMSRHPRFIEFMKSTESDPMYTRFSFKTTMTKIISRPAKYGLIMESIAKSDVSFSKGGELTQKAIKSARTFAQKIDNNLSVAHIIRCWEDIRSHLDLSSHTNLYIVDRNRPGGAATRTTFTMEDLNIEMKNSEGRRLLCLGDVQVKVSGSVGNKMDWIPVFMVLFDDLLVCLIRKGANGRYTFIQQEQAVFPVSTLILRVPDRSASIFIMSGGKPVLLEVKFRVKADRVKWIKTLETAIHAAPVKVRLSTRTEDETARQLAKEKAAEEKKQKQAEEAWMAKLREIFDSRQAAERTLADYMESRLKFCDEVRAHMLSLPFKQRQDITDRIKEAIRQSFKELRLSRTLPLNKLVDMMTTARESDLWSFFDDRADAADNQGDSDGGSGSDSSQVERSAGMLPRRIQTFHGTTHGSRDKTSFRRHTTVPRMSMSQDAGMDRSEEGVEDKEAKREGEEIDKMVHKLPLGLTPEAHKAASRLVRDVARLKAENNTLRNEVAFDKARIAMMERSQCLPQCSTSSMAPADTMEALRKKEHEVREENARCRRDLDAREEELKEKEMAIAEEKRHWEEEREAQKVQLQRSEAELAEKWAALNQATVRSESGLPVTGRLSMGTPPDPRRQISFRDTRTSPMYKPMEITPALKNLTTKTEVKKTKK